MVEAAVQEGIVLKIFKKLRGVWLALDLVTLEDRSAELFNYCCIHAPDNGILKFLGLAV